MKPKQLKVVNLDRQVCILRLSLDGKLLLAGGQDATIRRLDAASPELKPLAPLTGHEGWVTAMALHPDGKRLLSADSWGKLICWAFAEPQPKPLWSPPQAHDGWIRSVALAPDGQTAATAGADGKLVLWSCADGKKLRELGAPGVEVYSAVYHPDGKTLVSGDCRGMVRKWEASSGKLLGEIDARAMHTTFALQELGGVRCMTFDPKGTRLVLGGATGAGGKLAGPSVLLLDWATGKIAQTVKLGAPPDGYVYDIAWHPEGFLAIVASGQPGQGKLFFLKPGETAPFVTQPLPNPHSLAFLPGGKRLIVSATNAGSNGNGRNLGKGKEYPGNYSPLHIFELS